MESQALLLCPFRLRGDGKGVLGTSCMHVTAFSVIKFKQRHSHDTFSICYNHNVTFDRSNKINIISRFMHPLAV